MRDTHMTEKDRIFMKLGKEVREAIKTPKEWREFKKYCDVYYQRVKSFQEYNEKTTKSS